MKAVTSQYINTSINNTFTITSIQVVDYFNVDTAYMYMYCKYLIYTVPVE